VVNLSVSNALSGSELGGPIIAWILLLSEGPIVVCI